MYTFKPWDASWAPLWWSQTFKEYRYRKTMGICSLTASTAVSTHPTPSTSTAGASVGLSALPKDMVVPLMLPSLCTRNLPVCVQSYDRVITAWNSLSYVSSVTA